MSTYTVDAPIRCVAVKAHRVRCSVGAMASGMIAPAVRFDSGPRDQLIVSSFLDRTERWAELRGAVLEDASWVLQGIGELTFSISTSDPVLLDAFTDDEPVAGIGELTLLGREVEWWRDGALRWKGVPVSAEVTDDGIVSFQCFDLGWYFSRRFMGAAQRRDLLQGAGQMDWPGLPYWVKTGGPVRDTSLKKRGAGSARMPGGATMTIAVSHPSHRNAGSLSVYATAYVRVQASAQVGDPIMSMVTTHPSTGAVQLPDPENNVARVTEATVLNGWNRVTCYSLLPPGGTTWNVGLTLLNAGTGNRYFDDVRMLKNDTNGNPESRDLVNHGISIVNHCNNDYGKRPTGIEPKVMSYSGTSEPWGIRHLEHAQVLDLLNAYGDRDDGFEWWIDPRGATPRICFAARRGTDQDAHVLHDRAVLGGGWVHDESDRSTGVVVLGEGSDIDRPEGGYVRTDQAYYVLTEHLERPPNGTPLMMLDPMAKGLWDQLSVPQVQLGEIRVPEYLWDELSPGDVFPMERTSGVFRTAATVRCQKITHDFATDTLVLT